VAVSVQEFRKALKKWYMRVKRDLPWRRDRDPYRVWVSEIMLQQTRVAAVIPYFQRFLDRFPTVESLAAAPEQDLLACWSGLGYYSRARNLQKAARQIVENGGFPSDYDAIRQLPGVGDYTAAAIASIIYNIPRAVLDGNVVRVLSRLTGDAGDIGSSTTRKRLQGVASELLDANCPGQHNQAVMELGATVCLPRQPQCLLCPVEPHCQARRDGVQNELPVKLRRKQPVLLEETVLIVQKGGKLLLRQRGAGESRLPGFWELPLAEELPDAVHAAQIGVFRHSITHHNYRFTVVKASIRKAPTAFQWIPLSVLYGLPLTTVAKKAIRL
jgi:A/G-specific adenine glycosylase